MRTRLVRPALALAAVALAVAVPTAFASAVPEVEPLTPAPNADSTTPVAESTNLWFVELQSPPAVKGTAVAKLNAEKKAFRDAAKAEGIPYKERFAFNTLWNGLSIQVDSSEAGALSRMDAVKAIYPVLTASIPPTSSISPELATAIAMTGADLAQASGYDGSGVKVAIMDTGIDYDHADLGGDGVTRTNSSVFPTSRVTHGRDLVGDAFNAAVASPAYNPTPAPDNFPDDCNGHGTHVAGIVGANGDVTGVAPGVTFGAYRVFGCEGSTTVDIMIAAMEAALADGMDVLNMSIGSAFNTWAQYPTAAASDNLVDQGMVVVASIGNSGANGVYSAGAPGVGNEVIGVASYDNSHVELSTFTVTPANLTIGYGNAAGAPPAPTSGSLPLDKSGTPASAADACNVGGASPFTSGQFAGKAVLIRRGTCTFYEKAFNAQNAGAAAVVLYNNVAGRFSPTVAGTPAITIPVVAVSNTEGVAINNAIAAEPQTLNWTDETGTFTNPTGGLISSFSSYGLGAELQLKPDIGAPGGLIRSTWPLEGGAYATISGTSMSSPHVAGGVALLLEAKGKPTNGAEAAAVRGLLQNTADPKPWWGNPGLGFFDNVHRQGAGMMQIDRAITAPVSVSPGKISLAEAGSATTQTLSLSNSSSSAITYDLSHQPALSTFGSTFAPSFTTTGATAGGAVTFSSSSVMVPANGTATVSVTIPRPDFGPANKLVYGGWIRLSPQGEGLTLRVPYAGFGGDYQGFPVMTSGGAAANPFPKLIKRVGFVSASDFTPTYNTNPAAPVTYTLTTTTVFGRPVVDTPTVGVHLDHQVRWLRMTLLDAAGVPVGGPRNSVVLLEEYLPRNSTSGAFFPFEWDGTFTKTAGRSGKIVKAPQPDGQYRLRIDILKAGGDAATPGHTESYTSPVFILDRP